MLTSQLFMFANIHYEILTDAYFDFNNAVNVEISININKCFIRFFIVSLCHRIKSTNINKWSLIVTKKYIWLI